ncbi:hypothetical protein [Actinoplanes sp. NPDC049599]|uniref:hypothetical protein n=1 Tax=Actinoplanes sp. NPDC049599 TaxID=3363903 RepID=UPI0037B4B4CE
MEGHRLPSRLARAGHLLETAEARLAVLTAGSDHPRAAEARDWLRGARYQVVRATGGLGRGARSALSVLLMGGAIWAVSTLLGEVAGLPGGWAATITLPVVLFGLAFPFFRLLNAVDRRVGRRRLARSRSAPAVTPPPGVGAAGETLALLRLARGELTALMRERSAGRPTAAAFDRLRWRDARLAALSAADRDVCVAILALEIWLSAPERAAG